jgi:acyl carrier protein
MHNNNLENLHLILEEAFPNDPLPNDISDLRMGDLPSWDSLGNFNLILAVETKFNTRFSMEQISEIKSVTEILKALEISNE